MARILARMFDELLIHETSGLYRPISLQRIGFLCQGENLELGPYESIFERRLALWQTER
jgi:hypothetical protein